MAAAIVLALTITATSASGLPNRSSPAVVIAPVAPAASADPAGRVRGTIIMIHGGGWAGHDARSASPHGPPGSAEINAARVWATLRASENGVRALSMLAGGRARIIVRTGQRSRITVVPATPARGAR